MIVTQKLDPWVVEGICAGVDMLSSYCRTHADPAVGGLTMDRLNELFVIKLLAKTHPKYCTVHSQHILR